MNIKIILTLTIICLTFFGCKTGTKTVETNQTNVNSTNSNQQNATVEKVETVSSDKVFSSIATPRDTFKSHYAALAANNDELLKKTVEQKIISLYGTFAPNKKVVEIMWDILTRQKETFDMPDIISETTEGNHSIIKWKGSNGIIVEQPLGKEKDGWKMLMGK